MQNILQVTDLWCWNPLQPSTHLCYVVSGTMFSQLGASLNSPACLSQVGVMGYLNIVTIPALGLCGQTSGNMQRRNPVQHLHLASVTVCQWWQNTQRKHHNKNLVIYLSQQRHNYCLNGSTVRILVPYGWLCILGSGSSTTALNLLKPSGNFTYDQV
jgi:hypothetical protein